MFSQAWDWIDTSLGISQAKNDIVQSAQDSASSAARDVVSSVLPTAVIAGVGLLFVVILSLSRR